MTKNEFLKKLGGELSGLPKDDIQKSIDYYSEIIDDRIEDGMTEEEATAAMGNIDSIAAQILSDTPLTKLVKAKVKPKNSLKAWQVILIILGSPMWLPLLFAFGAVLFAVYIVLWSVILVIYVTDFSMAVSTVWGFLGGAVMLILGNIIPGIAAIGIGFISLGLTIFMFFGAIYIAKGILFLSKKIMFGIKSCFVRKEEV